MVDLINRIFANIQQCSASENSWDGSKYCFFKGVCDTFDGVCQCSPGYTGDNCSTKTGLLLVCTGWDGSSNTDTCEVIDPIQDYGNIGYRVSNGGIQN